MIHRLQAPRLRATRRDRWRSYLDQIEPRIIAQPRVHRFGRPPLLGERDQPAEPLAVWVQGGGDLAARTRASVQAGTRPATRIVQGSLASALAGLRDERVVLLQAGDELAPQALERLGQAARLAPDAAVITSDSDLISSTGRRRTPRLRPGPSPDRWLARDASGPLLTVDRRLTLELAGELAGAEPADGELGGRPGWRHELALRLAGPASARHAHVPMLLCHQRPDHDHRAGLTGAELDRILAAWEPAARTHMVGDVRWVRRPVSREISVEVIVCFRDRAELLKRCVGSLLATTRWEPLSVTLIDNGSIAAATEAEVRRLSRDPRVRVLHEQRPFNFAALNNAGARSSTAEVVVFLNNDTEIVDQDWIAVLLEEALRPEIGAVAPLLLYPNGKVQHAGAAIGLHGYAGHPFAGLSPAAETPFGRADEGTRNWLAVTAACLMVQRAKFWGVGGFDEGFVVAGNDVDLGLRLTAAGHRSVCVPHTRLVHDESTSRGAHVDPGDFAASERSYGAFRTVGDPFYNPNLTLRATDCGLRTPAEP